MLPFPTNSLQYFSASGVTAKLATGLADAIGADVHEIKPELPYTPADLDWRDASSRSSIEMKDPSSRPAIAGRCEGMAEYDAVCPGFPIWWYVAPTIVNTFLERHELACKTIVPFATSGGSGMNETNARLAPSCPNGS